MRIATSCAAGRITEGPHERPDCRLVWRLSSGSAMFPSLAALCIVGVLALAIAPVYPFCGWRGLAKNIVTSIMHAVIFFEPVFID